ncbi:MAG TPA: bifunctional diguanylate cyclase/phosphodiesterase [Thermoleophilaceae bacterium]|nr:bifunctional diguanylate cyclase/phosphodiesterase [Thermoleophilaceae bacterium]
MRYWSALAGLGVVLVVLAGFGGVSALRTSSATDRVVLSNHVSAAYERARFAVGQEESLENMYRVEPEPDVRARFDDEARKMERALRDAGHHDSGRDERLTRRLSRSHRAYVRATRRLFAAVDAGDLKRVVAIDRAESEPRFASIESSVGRAARGHARTAQSDLRRLRATERSVLMGTAAVSGIGLLLLLFLTVVLFRINRQLARQARASEHDALHDPLTGLPNRALLLDRLEHAIVGARRDPSMLSVLVLDLDRFKEINDTLGHHAGDQVLTEVGPRLAPVLRPGDTLARLSGDEFALLLPAVGIEQAEEVAGRVRAAMQTPFELGDLTVTVDASVGIVTYPTHGEDAETLLQRADIAMYLCKGRGRGHALYDPADDPYDSERLLLIGDLRDAIDAGELTLEYQPKFNVADLSLIGVEALVRWQHPTRGKLPPDSFIPLAEHTGLIRPLTLEVLRKAARQWAKWHDAGLELTVAVNLSVANLLDNQLVEDVARIIAEEHMPPDRLILEITESTVMSDPERTVAMLERLADMKIQLSIDDYGTGHSSLAYLRRLPVHELKIDRSFVQHLSTDDGDAQIVYSTIDLAHSLGLRVVAEGVEDADSLELLQAHHCDRVQGFHLGRPVAPGAIFDATAPPPPAATPLAGA